MPKLKVLSGKEVLKIFASFGFQEIYRKGSHVKLRRVVDGQKQTLTLPDHKNLNKGLLKALINQASEYISRDKLIPHFYH